MKRRVLVIFGIVLLALMLGFAAVQAATIFTFDDCAALGGPPCDWMHTLFPDGCVEVYLPLRIRNLNIRLGNWTAGRCLRGDLDTCEAGTAVIVPDLGHWEGSGDYPYADGDGNVTLEVINPCGGDLYDLTHLYLYVGGGDPNTLAALDEWVDIAATFESSRGWFVFHVAGDQEAPTDQYTAIIQELEAEYGVPFGQMWVKGGPNGDHWHNLGDMLNDARPAE
jgi:hypothetical protein